MEQLFRFRVIKCLPYQIFNQVQPNPVSNIAALVDSTNVTLEFPRPEGRIEYYMVFWNAVTDTNEPVQTKNVSQNCDVLAKNGQRHRFQRGKYI